jgi:hypothetical protein
MPFTPWSSVQDFIDLIEFVGAHHLVTHVDPVQYGIRLLLPPGSPLLALPDTQPHLRGFDEEKFTFLWEHPDPAMDRLQSAVAACAEAAAHAGQEVQPTFAAIRELAYRAANRNPARNLELAEAGEKSPPRLTEHWFC